MNTLTADFITHVGSQVHPDNKYHASTIAYVQTLLKPYAEAIETATSVDGIAQWVPLALPGELAKHANSEMNKFVGKVRNGEDTTRDEVTAAKTAVIEYLIAEILELAGNETRNAYDVTSFPWDVQLGIAKDEELSKMFGVVLGTDTLPVTVSVGPQKFTHMLSFDFVAGLLLFSHPSVDNRDFHVTMFEVPLDPSYMVPRDNEDTTFRYSYDEAGDHGYLQNYTVKAAGRQFTFRTPAFMQGFATGASWINVDHHKYWTELKDYTGESEEGVPVSF